MSGEAAAGRALHGRQASAGLYAGPFQRTCREPSMR